MPYEVLYSKQFHGQMMELPDSVYGKVDHSIDVLSDNPGLLREYDPPYEAALPPVDCRWYYVPGTSKVLYLAGGGYRASAGRIGRVTWRQPHCYRGRWR